MIFQTLYLNVRSGDKMKKYLMAIFFLILSFTGCAENKLIQQNGLMPEIDSRIESFNFWLDEETGTVHKVSRENGKEKVVSIIKYRKGIPLEEMKIISSDQVNENNHWIYFVPTTGYTVELTVLSEVDNSIDVAWKNSDENGEEDSGKDKLVRCDENGFINGTLSPVEGEELPDDF